MDWLHFIKCFYLVSALGSFLFVKFYAPVEQQRFDIVLFAILTPVLNTLLAIGYVVTFILDACLFVLKLLTKKR